MKIDAVDFFYLAMPEIRDIGDGSQDACLVRVRAGGHEGWGECEAAPLVTIAGWCAPMSHSACKPVSASVLGQDIEDPADIAAVGANVRANSLDMLQADHVLSGIDIALWDLLGKKLEEPVWRLLGYKKAAPKLPYASVLFGDNPQQTLDKAKAIRTAGFKAAKFGWGPFGKGQVGADRNQVLAAREGLLGEGILLVDAGTVWVEDVEQARRRLSVLRDARALWLEEPFVSGAMDAYAAIASEASPVKLAGGEGCHNVQMARLMIDHASLGYIQIDTGRIGGITSAKIVADYAYDQRVTYVNHSFTSHLALSASLQPFAGFDRDEIAEYPYEASPLARAITRNHIERDEDGFIHVPDAPGLGMTVDTDALEEYLVQAEIKVGRTILYRTPSF